MQHDLTFWSREQLLSTNVIGTVLLVAVLVIVLIWVWAGIKILLAEREATEVGAGSVHSPRWATILIWVVRGLIAVWVLPSVILRVGLGYGALTIIAVILLYPSARLWDVKRRSVAIALSSLLITLNLGLVCFAIWLIRDSSPDGWLVVCATALGVNAGMAVPALYIALVRMHDEPSEEAAIN